MTRGQGARTGVEASSRRFWVLVAVVGLALQFTLVALGGLAASAVLGFESDHDVTPTASFEVNGGDGSYAIQHEGGDAFAASHLVVRRNGERIGTWADLSPTPEAEGTVRPGDAVALPNADAGDAIGVYLRNGSYDYVLSEEEVDPKSAPPETSQRSSRTTGTPRPATSAAKAAESPARLSNVS